MQPEILDGRAAYAWLVAKKLTAEQAVRMLKTAYLYGLVNFESDGEHLTVKHDPETHTYIVGPADWGAAAKLC